MRIQVFEMPTKHLERLAENSIMVSSNNIEVIYTGTTKGDFMDSTFTQSLLF
jgi:hypothetical protein